MDKKVLCWRLAFEWISAGSVAAVVGRVMSDEEETRDSYFYYDTGEDTNDEPNSTTISSNIMRLNDRHSHDICFPD